MSYWRDEFDWRRWEEHFNALPQFVINTTGQRECVWQSATDQMMEAHSKVVGLGSKRSADVAQGQLNH